LNSDIPFNIQSSKNYLPERESYESIEHRFIQMVGSDFKKNNAENYSIRIDCNLPQTDKESFIDDLIQICREENLDVFFYNDALFKDHCNLMLFLVMADRKKMEFKRCRSILLEVKCGISPENILSFTSDTLKVLNIIRSMALMYS
jgi:hypothetical protein